MNNFLQNLSIQKKLTLLILSVSVCIATTYTVYTLIRTKHSIEQQLTTHATTTGRHLRNVLSIPVWDFNASAIENILKATMSDQNIHALAVIDTDTDIHICVYRRKDGTLSTCTKDEFSKDAMQKSFTVYHEGTPIGTVYMAFSGVPLRDELRSQAFVLIISNLILLTAIISILYHGIYATILAPLETVTTAVKQLSQGDFSHPVALSQNDEIGTLATTLDTMRIAIEEKNTALRATRKDAEKHAKSMHLMLSNSNDIFQITDQNGHISFISDSVSRILGYTPQELQKKLYLEKVHPHDRKDAALLFREILAHPNTNFRGEFRVRHKDGAWIILESIGCNLLNEPAVAGVLINIRDITQRRRAEEKEQALQEQIHQTQKMEALGQLAGGIAHDFNNALSGIIGASELLQTTHTTQEQREYTRLIITAAERAGSLTRKMLSFARSGKKTNTCIDCHAILTETASLLKHSLDKKITLSVELHATESKLIGDAALLQNAIMNMGINASHAMKEGGRITISTHTVTLDAEYCKNSPFSLEEGLYIDIMVEDTGCGMPKEVADKIFDPFFTTKEVGKGTGLGMATVYGTVQDHGGAITLSSEEGVGTVFHIYLPVTKDTRSSFPQERVVTQTEAGTILIIDDEELIRHTAQTILQKKGYHAYTASDGPSGVTLFRKKKKEIDLIILDMNMPVMSGRETFEEIRTISPQVPVLISSGFSHSAYVTTIQEESYTAFLQKPFRRQELYATVATVLQKIRRNTQPPRKNSK
ncbi:response regulator [Chitinivibrio alkaliphilus]|uniref:histidine kinase n=1 Tax=Chitinivibrio alkaliphilus ACht1 TaxID=1313304 RepID=U7DBK6_9BACT|nr:response regulator [Chitinivibrio alkaliphilus]ERP38953.1 PAS/PAC sensor hybrid histidine kinase [Chitinivibrio alkaliphilus ACht1]